MQLFSGSRESKWSRFLLLFPKDRTEIMDGDALTSPLDTFPLPGADYRAGANNTLVGGPRPDRSGFFVPRFFLPFGPSALSCRACDEYKTLRGNKSAAPTAVVSARRPFRASSHRLTIDSRSPE